MVPLPGTFFFVLGCLHIPILKQSVFIFNFLFFIFSNKVKIKIKEERRSIFFL